MPLLRYLQHSANESGAVKLAPAGELEQHTVTDLMVSSTSTHHEVMLVTLRRQLRPPGVTGATCPAASAVDP